MHKIYLACYHGRAEKPVYRIFDNITKFSTRGKCSHCEIAIHVGGDKYDCYSSSYRDGGVRVKTMELDPQKWDLIPLNGLSYGDVRWYFHQTQGADYDLLGALGCVIGLRQHEDRYFCSEWCFNAIFGSNSGWRFSPVQLADIVGHLSYLDD